MVESKGSTGSTPSPRVGAKLQLGLCRFLPHGKPPVLMCSLTSLQIAAMTEKMRLVINPAYLSGNVDLVELLGAENWAEGTQPTPWDCEGEPESNEPGVEMNGGTAVKREPRAGSEGRAATACTVLAGRSCNPCTVHP